jgi:ATP-dependent DNA helicase RecQ
MPIFVQNYNFMDIFETLKRYFGYDSFRENQEEIIRHVLAGNDALVLMPTGGGKSLCYQIPALALEGTTVVISPLISLMKDQVETLRANGIAAEALNSGNDSTDDLLIRRRCVNGDIKLLYISPERAIAEADHLLSHMKLSLLAVDEAHCISQWGHDFRPEYTQLAMLREKYPDVPMMALTATADKVTRQDIIEQLQLRQAREFISSFDRPNLSLSVKRGYKNAEKTHFILNFIKARPLDAGIIYCLSRKTTEKVAEDLRKKGINAAAYHAGMTPLERNQTQELFKNDQLLVVCATIAFGMGIDKSNVRWVIHYNMPKSIESFYQEIGRAGRDGAPADTVLFYSLADIIQLTEFAKQSGQQDVNMEKLRRMQEYAESSVCRRRILLNYFSEQTDHDCGNCDVCENPPQRFDGSRYVQMALSAAKRANEEIRISTIIEILKGIHSPTVNRNGFDRLKTFGVGKELTTTDWQDYLLQMLQMGFIEIAYNEGNKVKVTDIGEDVLYGRKNAQLYIVDHSEKERPKKKTKLRLEIPTITIPGLPPTTGIEDPKLFEVLRSLRMTCAEEEGFPPYIIFSDKVLHALATIKPITLEQFGNISGIGEHKRQKYGERFVALIKKYV